MKIKFVHRAYNYFWVMAFLIFIKGCAEYLIYGYEVMDINIHDSYIVVPTFGVTLFNTLLLALIGGVYRIAYWSKLPLNQRLIKMHTGLSFLPFIISSTLVPIIHLCSGKFNFSWYNQPEVWFFICTLLFVMAQLLLAINYTVALFRHLTAPKPTI